MQNLLTIQSFGVGVEVVMNRKPEIRDISTKITIEKKGQNTVLLRIKPQIKADAIYENNPAPLDNGQHKQATLEALNKALLEKEIGVAVQAPFNVYNPNADLQIKQFCQQVILQRQEIKDQLVSAALSLFVENGSQSVQNEDGQCGEGCTCGFANLTQSQKESYFRNEQLLENLDVEITNKQKELDELNAIKSQYSQIQEELLNNLNKSSSESGLELVIIPIN